MNGGDNVLAIELTITVIVEVLNHLFRSPFDPLRGLGAGALVPTQHT